MLSWRKLCVSKPIFRKFILAIRHIATPKHTELKHFLWSELGFKFGIKMFSSWCLGFVGVSLLHMVMYRNFHTISKINLSELF